MCIRDSTNTVVVDLMAGGLTDVTTDNPLGWAYIPAGVRLVCASPHTGCRVFDAAGRLVELIPEVDNNTEITLPRGAFFIITDQQPTPLRVLVRE